MNCPNCNAPIRDNQMFCGNCGANLSAINAANQKNSVPFQNLEEQPQPMAVEPEAVEEAIPEAVPEVVEEAIPEAVEEAIPEAVQDVTDETVIFPAVNAQDAIDNAPTTEIPAVPAFDVTEEAPTTEIPAVSPEAGESAFEQVVNNNDPFFAPLPNDQKEQDEKSQQDKKDKNKGEKKSKKGLIITIIAIVVVLLAAAAVAAFVWPGFLTNKGNDPKENDPDTPASVVVDEDAIVKEYIAAELSSIDSGMSDFSNAIDIYSDLFDNSKTKISLELPQSSKYMLTQSGVSQEFIDIISNVDITVDIAKNDSDDATRGMKLMLTLNNEDIIGTELISDTDYSETYIGFPELTEYPVYEDMEGLLMLAKFCDILGELKPDDATVEDIKNVIQAALETTENVQKTTKEMTLNDVSQEVVVYSYEIDEEALLKMVIAALNELKESDDLNRYIIDTVITVLTALDADESLTNRAYYDGLDEAIAELEEQLAQIQSDETAETQSDYHKEETTARFNYELYTDTSGAVIGRKLVVNSESKTYFYDYDAGDFEYYNTSHTETTLGSIKLTSGENYTSETYSDVYSRSTYADGDEFDSCSGRKISEIGTVKDGKFTGDMYCYVRVPETEEDYKLVFKAKATDLTLEPENMATTGKISFNLDEFWDIVSNALEQRAEAQESEESQNSNQEIITFLKTLDFEATFNGDIRNSKTDINVTMGTMPLFTIVVESSETDYQPDSSNVDYDYSGANFANVMENLADAGFPEDVIATLEAALYNPEAETEFAMDYNAYYEEKYPDLVDNEQEQDSIYVLDEVNNIVYLIGMDGEIYGTYEPWELEDDAVIYTLDELSELFAGSAQETYAEDTYAEDTYAEEIVAE